MLDRESLELNYDRPSFHSESASDRVIGRISAIIDWHMDHDHADIKHLGLSLYDLRCEHCGFDVRAALHRLFPETASERINDGPLPR